MLYFKATEEATTLGKKNFGFQEKDEIIRLKDAREDCLGAQR